MRTKLSISEISPGSLFNLQYSEYIDSYDNRVFQVKINDTEKFSIHRYQPIKYLTVNELIEIEGPLVLKIESCLWANDIKKFCCPTTICSKGHEHLVMGFRTETKYVLSA